MLKQQKNSIRKIYVIILLFWVFTIGATILFYVLIDKKAEKTFLTAIHSFTQTSNNIINFEIEERMKVLDVTAKYLSNRNFDQLDDLYEWFDEIVEKNNFKRIIVALPDGKAWTNDGLQINISEREYFKKSLNGISNVSYLINSLVDEDKINCYSVPIYKDSKIIGVLTASTLTHQFFNNLHLDFMNGMAEIYFIDHEGTLITGADTEDKNFFNFITNDTNYNINKKSLEKMQSDMQNSIEGYQVFRYKNQTSYMFYTKTNYSDWWILTKIPESVVHDHNEELRNILLLALGFISLMSTAAFINIIKVNKTLNKQIESSAFTDTITNGKNDIYFKEYLKREKDKNNGINGHNLYFVNLTIMDIEKLINILGFKPIYSLIREIYEYIEGILDKRDIVVHSYQGEFKLLIHSNEEEYVIHLIRTIRRHFDNQFEIKVGIVLIEDDHCDFEILSAYANVAKAHIPKDDFYAFYTEKIHNDEIDKSRLEEDIKRAITNKEFKAWIQPKIGKDGKTIIGGEALVRWYKYGTIIPPYIFLPICEANGLIRSIDEIVLEDVCEHLKRWQEQGLKNVPISVNLSRSYINDEGLLDHLDHLIEQYGIDKALIEFEITENALVNNENLFKSVLQDIKKRGYRLLLDDFGVGYSSLKSIAESNFDVLKIDKSFVDGIGSEKVEKMIKYTIALAKEYDMQVIAEGIENKSQYEFLLNHRCEKFQGYYFYKPVDTQTFEELLIHAT